MSRAEKELLDVINAGVSKCPICGREWLVTPMDDCMLPACGCYGSDTGPDNPNRPCHRCGTIHAFAHRRGKEQG
jgi:hypothetical protein